MACHRRICIAFLAALSALGHAQAEPPALTRVVDLAVDTRPANVPSDYVATPAGYFHPSCVVYLADGEQVTARGDVRQPDQSVRQVQACTRPSFDMQGAARERDAAGVDVRPAASFSGWLAYSETNPGGVAASEMVADWVVPSAPASATGQVLYYFPGLESSSVVTILQPVLAWNGYNNNAWTMANWNCCKSGTVYTGKPINVRVDDQIHGAMNGAGCKKSTPCTAWSITSTDVTTGQSTTFQTSSYNQLFNWYFGGVMEVYGVGDCAQFPANGSITFTNVKVWDYAGHTLSPTYGGRVASGAPSCGYDINATTSQTVIGF
jgi:hypothetical protein